MTNPTIGNYGGVTVDSASPLSSVDTGSFAVKTGDSVYVFIGYHASSTSGGVSVSQVIDSTGRSYTRAGVKQNNTNSDYPAIEIWYADNVPENSSLTVNVVFSSATWGAISAVEISGTNVSNSFDGASAGNDGLTPTSSPSSLDPTNAVNSLDLVIACICYERTVGTITSGWGFTMSSAIDQNGSPSSNDVGIEGLYYDAPNPGTLDSKLYTGTSKPYAILTVSIRPAVLWSEVSGKPYVVVSPLGIANGLSGLVNGGADFGPDTPGTSTSGIQEAINALTSGGRVLLTTGTYTLGTTSVILPVAVAVSLESYSPDEVAGGSGTAAPTACLDYTGTGFAIDSSNTSLTPDYTGSTTTPAPVGYVDGIMVYSPNGNGVRINNVVYQIGRLSVYGTNASGNSIGLQISPIGNGPEVTIRFVRVIGFKTEIIIAQDHVSIGHINTSLCTDAGTVLQWGNGGSNRGPLGLAIQYWHHYGGGSGLVPSFIFDYETTGTQAHSGFIGSMFLEVPSTTPSSAIVRSSSGFGSNLVIANLDYRNGGLVGFSLLEMLGTVPSPYSTAVPGVNLLNLDNYTPQGYNITNPSVPASNTAFVNPACRPVLIIILSAVSGTTAAITDANGNAGLSFPLIAGSFVYLPYGASITVTYTTKPTWQFFGL
jgi:hypothetical protein